MAKTRKDRSGAAVVMSLKKPAANVVTAGQLLDAHLTGALGQFATCIPSDPQALHIALAVDDLQKALDAIVKVWNEAKTPERRQAIRDTKIELRFQPFDLIGLFNSGAVSGSSFQHLKGWLLIRKDKEFVLPDFGAAAEQNSETK